MINLTKKQLNKAKRLTNVANNGLIGIIQEIDVLDEKISDIEDSIKGFPAVIQGIDGVDGKDGRDGKDGTSYVLSKSDKKEIAKLIAPTIKPEIITKTVEIIKQPIVNNTETKIETKVENPFILIGNDVINKINEDNTTLIKRDKIEGLKGIEERIQAIGQVASTVKGGTAYGKIIAGPNITVRYVGTDAIVSSTASGSGGGFNTETPTGAVDDTNVTFTVLNTPNSVVVNGNLYFNGAGFTYAAGTITLNAPVGVGGFIRSIY